MRILLLVLTWVIFMESCRSRVQECFVPKSVSVQVGFRVIDTVIIRDLSNFEDTSVVIKDTNLFFPTFTSLQAEAENVTFEGTYTASSLNLFLNPDSPSIKYLFKPDRARPEVDTITIEYEPYSHFISNSCGYTYYYRINSLKVAGTVIDSAIINNMEVTTSATNRNIILYFID